MQLRSYHGYTCIWLILCALTVGCEKTDEVESTAEEQDPVRVDEDDGSLSQEEAPPASAIAVTPPVDVNPCSVLSQADIAELGYAQFVRRGDVVGYEDSLALRPVCHWKYDRAREIKVTLEPAANYRGGDDTASVGEKGHFSKNVAGDPVLAFVSGALLYQLVTDGVHDEAADRAELLGVAERIIANASAQTGLFDGLATGELVGGPAKHPCDLIDPAAVATQAGLGHFLAFPAEGGRLTAVECLIASGSLAVERVAFIVSKWPCTGDKVEVAGHTACFGADMTGTGQQLVVDMGTYKLVLSSQSGVESSTAARLQALASSIIRQL